jgi:hypothetical protein
MEKHSLLDTTAERIARLALPFGLISVPVIIITSGFLRRG